MLQSFEQKAHRFENNEKQTLKNKKRPYRPFAVSIYRAAINYDQSTNESQAERLARSGLVPETRKESRPRGGGWGWWAVAERQKPLGTFEPKARKAKKRRANGEAASGERGAQRPSGQVRANIVPVIRPGIPFRRSLRSEERAKRVNRLY